MITSRRIIAGAAIALSAMPLLAQEAALKSGPQAGTVLPGAFSPHNLKSKVGTDRHHCLVCEFNLDPVLLVFVREPAPGKDMVFNDFLLQVEKAVDRHELNFLKSFVIFLSPAARSSVHDPDVEDPGKLVDEATIRKALIERLKPRVEAFRNLSCGVLPAEGPKGYNIDPKAEITIVFYKRHRVLANFAFEADKMTAADANNVLLAVDKLVTVEPLDK